MAQPSRPTAIAVQAARSRPAEDRAAIAARNTAGTDSNTDTMSSMAFRAVPWENPPTIQVAKAANTTAAAAATCEVLSRSTTSARVPSIASDART